MSVFSPVLVHEFLSESARTRPGKPAIITREVRLSYRELDRQSDALAGFLKANGFNKQDRAIVFLDNSAETVIGIYGILKAGGAFVVLNPGMKAGKLAYILKDSGASFIITQRNRLEVVSEAIAIAGQASGRPAPTSSGCPAQDSPRPATILVVGSPSSAPSQLGRVCAWHDAVSQTSAPPPRFDYFSDDRLLDIDLCALIYTSGSTGEPKGVMSTHLNMVSAARSIIQYLGNTDQDVVLNCLPLSFDYGLYQVIMAVMYGGTVVLEKNFVFVHEILNLIAKEKVTGFPLVPTILAMLLKLEDFPKYDLSTLRYVSNTGAALPVEHIYRLRKLLPSVTVFSMFGLTECKRVGYLTPLQIDKRPGAVGKAMPNCEAFLVDENGKRLPAGSTGELVIRGSNVMQGYWNAPDLTARTYHPGRYPAERLLYSGDLFRMDEEGYLYFLGRRDDMIKSKGERISPKEVEDAICRLPGVAEAAVLGVPDEVLGQAIKTFVVAAPGVSLATDSVLRHCSQHLESFMVPKYVEFRSALPKTPNGKIDKKALKSEALPQ